MVGWECLFFNPKLQLILSVYVDGFKLAGKKENLKTGWKLMEQAGLELDPPTPFGDYLGCGQYRHDTTVREAKRRLEHIYPLVHNTKYGLSPAAQKDLAETEERLRSEQDHPEEEEEELNQTECKVVKAKAYKNAAGNRTADQHPDAKIPGVRYDMHGFFEQCIELYCTLAGKKRSQLHKVKTQSIDDHNIPPEDFEETGQLAGDAAKIVMKMLYGARLVRYDILWPICSIAREVSKWTRACDKRLERLVSYINCTTDYSLESFVGDTADQCSVLLHSDADFAGDMRKSKSTSGMYIAIVGPHTFAPIVAHCKKQTCVSHAPAGN